MKKKSNSAKGMFCAFFILFFIQGINAQEYNCRDIYNSTDVTEGLQKAINAGYKNIIIPFMGMDKIWIIQPLNMKSDVHISIDPDVVIQAKTKSVGTGQSLFTLKDVANVVISGGKGSIIQMPIEEYTTGEWRHAISILGSTNITIENLEISKSGGDGIYIGASEQQNYSENIKIDNVSCDGHARNGISVISVKKLVISDCSFTNTGMFNSPNLAKKGPYAGIDLEPNKDTQFMDDVLITNCNFSSNKHLGIFLYFGQLKSISFPVKIKIDKVNIKSSTLGIEIQAFKESFGGRIDITNVDAAELGDAAVMIRDWKNDKLKLSLDRITLTSANMKMPVVHYTEKAVESSSNITKSRISLKRK